MHGLNATGYDVVDAIHRLSIGVDRLGEDDDYAGKALGMLDQGKQWNQLWSGVVGKSRGKSSTESVEGCAQ